MWRHVVDRHKSSSYFLRALRQIKKNDPLSDALKMAIEHIKNTLIRKEVVKAVDQIPID
jgi:hypothetical protein